MQMKEFFLSYYLNIIFVCAFVFVMAVVMAVVMISKFFSSSVDTVSSREPFRVLRVLMSTIFV